MGIGQDIAKGAGSAIGSGIIGAGMGLALGPYEDWRQRQQQGKLMEIQNRGSKEMMDYQQEKAYEMWLKTNYSAQRKEMEKAGLNVGLMYEGGGQGGTLQQPSAMAGGATAAGSKGEYGMGMQMGLAAAQAKAQIELTQANANLANTQANKLKGVDTEEGKGRIALAAEQTKNEVLKGVLMKWDSKLKEIDTNVQQETIGERIKAIKAGARGAEAIAEQEYNAGRLSTETYKEAVKQIRLETISKELGLKLTEANIAHTNKSVEVMGEQIAKIKHDKTMDWEKLGLAEKENWIRDQERLIKQQQTDFQTSTPQQIRQYIGILDDLLSVGK